MRDNYNTNQRIILEKYLKNNEDKFISSNDILDFVKKEKYEIGLTTIYRFLNLLEKNNMVRIEIRNHTKYYQYISDKCNNHFHLKCKKCGKIIHLNCKEFEDVKVHILKEHKFQLDYNTIIYGICCNCYK